MSTSKTIWSSPQICRSRKLQNAKQLNDLSIQSLKFQILFFLIIISEICLNLLLKVFGGISPSIYLYKLICKTVLAINLVFILTYVYQIMKARIIMYLETRDNKSESILKSITFELLPQVKYYYEKLIKCKWLSQWLQKDALEQERIKMQINEERHKTLYRMYLPSQNIHYNSFNDSIMKKEAGLSTEVWPNSHFQDSLYMHTPVYHSLNGGFTEPLVPIHTSTPYSRARVMSSYPADMSSVQSPIQYMKSIEERATQQHESWSAVAGFNRHQQQVSGDDIMFSSFQQHQHHHQQQPLAQYSPTTSPHASNRGQRAPFPELSSSPELWRRLGIDGNDLDRWIPSMKQWLHGTIVARIVQEVDKVNAKLLTMGVNDVVIGQSSVQTLRQLLASNSSYSVTVPSLAVLIDFLDCCRDQQYVVGRLRELAQGCSLGKFQWDGGSTNGRHPWREHLPNDSVLLLHLLSTYIDSRVHSTLHGLTTFSQQFIIDNIDNKEPGDFKDTCVLLQASVQPPHFKVIFNEMIFNITPGRRNLFECLIVFFHKVYKNEGSLKWLNLGRSGLNLNWIFDNDQIN